MNIFIKRKYIINLTNCTLLLFCEWGHSITKHKSYGLIHIETSDPVLLMVEHNNLNLYETDFMINCSIITFLQSGIMHNKIVPEQNFVLLQLMCE